VAFTSNSSNLVGGDTNNAYDTFVREQGAPTQQPSDSIAPTTTARAGTDGAAALAAANGIEDRFAVVVEGA
jgi:hypothetical protein